MAEARVSGQGEVMDRSIARHSRFVLATLVVVLLASAAPLLLPRGAGASAVTVEPAAKAAATESVLVVRRAVDHDALWLLSPVDGTPTAAGDLPGFAGSVAVSPDGQNVAYLPENTAPRVWIGYGPLGPKTISLTSAGVKRVDSFCWIDAARLLVAGVTSRRASLRLDRLYVVNAATGRVRSFRGLYGAEPSFAPAARKVAYVKFSVVSPVPDPNGSWPTIRESMKLLSLDHAGAGRTVWTEDNLAFAEYRALSQPKVSTDATWYLTCQTGSDVRVTYDIRDRWGYTELSVFTPALQAHAGWDVSGRRTAFAGIVGIDDQSPCVWIHDVASGSLTRSASGVVPPSMIASLAWSASGQLVANAIGAGARHNYVLPEDLTSVNDLGSGRLPVWVR